MTDQAIDFVKVVPQTETSFMMYAARAFTVWGWGDNLFGELGLGTDFGHTTYAFNPIRLDAYPFDDITSGSWHSLFLRSGKLFACGWNLYGQTGTGIPTTQQTVLSPVQVGSLSNWTHIAGGDEHSLAINSNGNLFTWGRNQFGQLGLGTVDVPPTATTYDYSSPVQVGALTTWTAIAAGEWHSIAISAGKLYTWGLNNYGQLGLNDVIPRSSPVQVGVATNWVSIGCSAQSCFAINSLGQLFSWGRNVDGELGLGDIVGRSLPVQVGALTTWSKIRGPNVGYHAGALTTTGKLYTWGKNVVGQLGLGDTTSRSSPVQVGALTTWTDIVCGYLHMAGINSGRVFTWGLSNKGQLGLNTRNTSYSSPMQVGTYTTWTKLAATIYATLALRTI